MPDGAPATPVAWLDQVRVLAAVAVVAIHVVAPWVAAGASGEQVWMTANVVDSSLRWCVPVFVMTSGALLLDPRHQQPVAVFYRRRAARVLVPLLCWTALYLAVRVWWLDPGTDRQELLNAVARGSPFLHLYFLFLLVGLYLVTPLLRLVVQQSSARRLGGFVAVLTLLGVADQFLQSCCDAGEPNAVTRFLPFLGYYLGGWWARAHVPPIRRRVAVACALAAIAATIGLAAWTSRGGWDRTGTYVYGFLAPWVVVMSFAVFLALRDVALAPGHERWVRRLAPWTFGVFLVHPLVLLAVRTRPMAPPTTVAGTLLDVAALTAGAVLVSLLVVVVLSRVPLVRHAVT
jgi:surface polysaccharide O-acyltransferase-like enzyme